MRVLADENIAEQVIVRLRTAGYDVRGARETDRGEADPTLLALATRERRTLITYDKDFGDLVHRNRMTAPYGVILFRIHSAVPDTVKAEFVANSVMAWNRLPPGIWTIQIRHQ